MTVNVDEPMTVNVLGVLENLGNSFGNWGCGGDQESLPTQVSRIGEIAGIDQLSGGLLGLRRAPTVTRYLPVSLSSLTAWRSARTAPRVGVPNLLAWAAFIVFAVIATIAAWRRDRNDPPAEHYASTV